MQVTTPRGHCFGQSLHFLPYTLYRAPHFCLFRCRGYESPGLVWNTAALSLSTCVSTSSRAPLSIARFPPTLHWRCTALKPTLPAPPGTGRSHPLPIPPPPIKGLKARALWWPWWWPLGASGGLLWLLGALFSGRPLLSRPSSRPRWGPFCASAQASPCANLLLLHRCTTSLSSSSIPIAALLPTPTPTPRRWRTQLTSCRCYSSAPTVIQVAFHPEPHPRPSCLRRCV